MKTIPISKVNSELPESFVLITFSSFESRSNIIIKNIEQRELFATIFCAILIPA